MGLFTRGITGKDTRATEEKKAELVKESLDSEKNRYVRISNIKNRLGLSQKATYDDVRNELKRLRGKSDKTWQALKLNRKETLKIYGLA